MGTDSEVYVLMETLHDAPVSTITYGVYSDFSVAVAHAMRLKIQEAFWVTIVIRKLNETPRDTVGQRSYVTDATIDHLLQQDEHLKQNYDKYKHIWRKIIVEDSCTRQR